MSPDELRANPGIGGQPASQIAAALAAVADRVPPSSVDAVWLFPPRQLGARESGLAVLSTYAGEGAEGARTIYTLHYVLEPPAPKALPVRTDELAEQGTVPRDRVDRIIEGVLRRLHEPESPPDVREVEGDEARWTEILAGLSSAA